VDNVDKSVYSPFWAVYFVDKFVDKNSLRKSKVRALRENPAYQENGLSKEKFLGPVCL
jgi:hypothetical protein